MEFTTGAGRGAAAPHGRRDLGINQKACRKTKPLLAFARCKPETGRFVSVMPGAYYNTGHPRRDVVESSFMSRENHLPGDQEQHWIQQSHLLDNLLNASPDRIYFKDLRSRFIRMNHATARSFGLASPGDAVGKTDADFFSEEHARQAYEDEQQIISTGEAMVGKEEKETWPDGRVTWASSSKYAMTDDAGKIIGIIGISRDITPRKEAEEQREKLLRELRSAFEKIDNLKGLLPICASCKRIRDDTGSWAEVETYIQKRSSAHFSHGICPDCAARLYPDIPALE